MRVILIGNPNHRRVTDFQAALAEAGETAAEVVSYASLINNPDHLLSLDAGPAFVRQDSFGQDFEVERGLLRLGYAAALEAGASTSSPQAIEGFAYERGRIRNPRQLHLGFLSILEGIERRARERPDWDLLQAPSGIRRCFDKAAASAQWAGLGVPMPRPIIVGHHSSIRGRAFVKLTCGSSASCIAVFHVAGRHRTVRTTMEETEHGWFNSRRLQRYDDDASADRLWDFLHREGVHVERAVRRATNEGTPFDLRVVVIGGEPVFTVMRCSPGPMTNLHLGGTRGDWSRLSAVVPEKTWNSVEASCKAIARDTRCFTLGLDIVLSPDLGRHTVIEANAFGDLLPGLQRDGISVYRWQVERMRERWNNRYQSSRNRKTLSRTR